MNSGHTWVVGAALLLGSTAAAQSPRRNAPAIPAVKLTDDSVKRLIKAIPAVGAVSASSEYTAQALLPGPVAAMAPKALQQMQDVVKGYGFSLGEFGLQAMTLISTYLVVVPAAFARQMPRKNDPRLKKLLANPKLTTEQRRVIQQRFDLLRRNQDAVLAQHRLLATPNNQAVVRRHLAAVQSLMEALDRPSPAAN